MREIKFRAWDDKVLHMVPQMVALNATDATALAVYFGNEDIPIMQYTGLKDKNGVEIYEGDVVRVDGHNYKVVWGYQQCSFYLGIINTVSALQMYKALSGEVIGNIYENPELLKETK